MNETTLKVIKKFIQFKVEEIWQFIKDIVKTMLLFLALILFIAIIAGIVLVICYGIDYLCSKYDVLIMIGTYIGCILLPALIMFGILVAIQIWFTKNWKKAKRAVQNEKTK
jgi:uncharacterized membrane protein